MPSAEYWDGDPWLVKAYREAYKLRQAEENTMMWLQGMYNYIGVATALNNGFNNKKEKYPEKPFDLNPKKVKESPEEIRERYYMRFKKMQEMWDKSNNERNDSEN